MRPEVLVGWPPPEPLPQHITPPRGARILHPLQAQGAENRGLESWEPWSPSLLPYLAGSWAVWAPQAEEGAGTPKHANYCGRKSHGSH